MNSIAQVDPKATNTRRQNIHFWVGLAEERGEDAHQVYNEYIAIAPQAAAMYADVLQERASWQRIEQSAYYG